jgi:hypothetical protein
MRYILAVIGISVAFAGFAAEVRLSVPSDAKATYFILERGGSADKPTLVTKRVGPSGTSYSKRLFDCSARTWKYLGDGETLEEMRNSKPDAAMTGLVTGSIADYMWKAACRPK